MQTGTTSTTKTMTTSIPLCITEVMAAETEKGTDCPHYPEITHPRGEAEEGEMREEFPLTTPHPLPHQGPNPAPKF